MKNRKDFGIALLFWFLFGTFGGHRIYITEKVSIVLYYWFLSVITLGILPIVDVFRMKTLIDEQYIKDKVLNG
jgi:TM2 domain